MAYTSVNLGFEMDPEAASGVLLEHIYCAGINVGWARLGIHLYQGDNEPWNDPNVRSCIDSWMQEVVDYHNRIKAGQAPWWWTQYGAIVGKGFVSQQAPDEWNTTYDGNLYKWMWLVWGRASYPGIPAIHDTCAGTSTGQGITDIIDWLQAIAAHARASGFPFTNYESTISNMVDMLRRGATMPEVAVVFDNWEPGFRAQLRNVICEISEEQPPVLLEHIYTAGINVGWARLGIHLGSSPSDIISWLQGVISAAQASNFPFVNYEIPINNMIDMLNRGATMPEVAVVFDAWEPGFREQLKRSCNVTPTPALPTKFDWRDYGVIGLIRNQGRCGSCWAFSAAGTVEGTYCVEQNMSGASIDLSEQNLVSNCCPAGDCNGGWHHRALEYIRTSGIVDEICFPYQSQNCKYTNQTTGQSLCCDNQAAATFGCTDCDCPDGTCSNPCECNGCADWNNRLWHIQRWQKVQATVQDVQRALVDNGPLAIVSRNWGHALILVGYDDDCDICKAQYGQNGCWIIRNSWGLINGWANIVKNNKIVARVWHVNGYVYIPYTGHFCSDIINSAYLADGVIAP
jgi:hypothetical protein